jgi:hypothetical protein
LYIVDTEFYDQPVTKQKGKTFKKLIMVYQVYYRDYINSEIVLIDPNQDPVRGRWANLKEAKDKLFTI